MRIKLLALVLCLPLIATAQAQPVATSSVNVTRIGITTELGSFAGLGYAKPHTTLGMGVEHNFGTHTESQGWFSFSPDNKLDSGTGNSLQLGGKLILYPTKTIGITVGGKHTNLWTTPYHKSSFLFTAGTVIRLQPFLPGRVYLDYDTQIGPKIDLKTGVESSKLKCLEANPEVRVGYLGPFTVYGGARFFICHGYSQGNPYTDGTFGATTNPRTSYTRFASTGIITFGFGRHKDEQY